jgi:hypothetical protein
LIWDVLKTRSLHLDHFLTLGLWANLNEETCLLLKRRFKVAYVWGGSVLVIPDDTSRHFTLLKSLESRVDFVQSIGTADEFIELKLLGKVQIN